MLLNGNLVITVTAVIASYIFNWNRFKVMMKKGETGSSLFFVYP